MMKNSKKNAKRNLKLPLSTSATLLGFIGLAASCSASPTPFKVDVKFTRPAARYASEVNATKVYLVVRCNGAKPTWWRQRLNLWLNNGRLATATGKKVMVESMHGLSNYDARTDSYTFTTKNFDWPSLPDYQTLQGAIILTNDSPAFRKFATFPIKATIQKRAY